MISREEMSPRVHRESARAAGEEGNSRPDPKGSGGGATMT